MNNRCALCNNTCGSLGLLCPNKDYFCQNCYNEIFRVNVLITCPACSKVCKISDFSWQILLNQGSDMINHNTQGRLFSFSEEPRVFFSRKCSEVYENRNFSSQEPYFSPTPKEKISQNHFDYMIIGNENTGKEMPECMNLDSVMLN